MPPHHRKLLAPDTRDETSGLAPGMQNVNTYLAVANVNASMEFLERAFAFTRGVVLPDTDGQVRYAEMRHGDSVIMLVRRGDSRHGERRGGGIVYLRRRRGPGGRRSPQSRGRRDRCRGPAVGRPHLRRHRPRRLSLGSCYLQEAGAVHVSGSSRRIHR